MSISFDCLFCKIVTGEVPSHKIFEDAETVAFLDIHPSTAGHTLVVPKEHGESILASSEAAVASALRTVRAVAPIVMEVVGSTGFNLHVNTGQDAGQVIFHTHLHILPRRTDDGRRLWGTMEDPPDLPALAEQIRAKMT